MCARHPGCDKSHRRPSWRPGAAAGSIGVVPSDYRLSPALAARLLGTVLVLVGLLMLLLALAVAWLSVPPVVLTVGVVVGIATLLVVGWVVTRRASVVHLDEEGYRVSFVRGAGVSRARWTDVEDVVATTVAGERCVVLRLRDGRTTTVPVRLLAVSPEAFVAELQGRLDRGHGYRRLR